MRDLAVPSAIVILAVLCMSTPGTEQAAPASSPAPETTKRYVCTPCDMACDKRCPDCGALLVEAASLKAPAAATRPAAARKKAAILIFDGVQIIDYTGLYEV